MMPSVGKQNSDHSSNDKRKSTSKWKIGTATLEAKREISSKTPKNKITREN